MNIAFGFLLVLGVLILVHEWGHFIVARYFGVRVDVFSIGFGPRLFGFKWGATDWRISAIPLNGIPNPTWGTVESVFSKGAEPRDIQITLDHQGAVRSLTVSTSGMKDPEHLFGYPPNTPLVGYLDKSKPASAAGIRRDDIIETMNGQRLNNCQEMITAIQKNGGKPAQVTVR